jgi:hypothetical protein
MTHVTRGFILISTVSLLGGCVSPYPESDRRFGHALNAAKEAQAINPAPARPRAVATGVDGRAAKETMDRYVDSFKAPPPTINVLNIGGALTGQ